MWRSIIAFLAVVSGIACAAICGLWLRSEYSADMVMVRAWSAPAATPSADGHARWTNVTVGGESAGGAAVVGWQHHDDDPERLPPVRWASRPDVQSRAKGLNSVLDGEQKETWRGLSVNGARVVIVGHYTDGRPMLCLFVRLWWPVAITAILPMVRSIAWLRWRRQRRRAARDSTAGR